MKKKFMVGGKLPPFKFKELLFVKRLVFILLILSSFTASAQRGDENVKLNLDFKKSPIIKILNSIEQQSEYRFAYNLEAINLGEKVSIKLEQKDIKTVLNKLFYNTDISYEIVDKHILLTPKKSQSKQNSKTISGQVTNADGEALIGVTVLIKGTSIGTVTDISGNYSLELPYGSKVLLFSFIGFKTKELLYKGQKTLNVALDEDSVEIGEVVAVGFGTQLKTRVTSAITSVDNKVLKKRAVSSVQEALIGAAPGLIISQESGRPGDTPALNIRGISTIGGSSGVLVLIDGIEGSISDVDPSMVDNISVLKDASAAAIYGARAANGVMLITTKSGKKSKKAIVNYKFDLGIQSPTDLPELVNSLEYMEMKNRALGYEGALPQFSESMIGMARNGELAETKWPDELYSDAAIRKSHSLNLTGGTKKTSYYLGLGVLGQKGIVTGADDYKRYNLRVKVETDVNNWLTVGTNTSWTNRKQEQVPVATGQVYRGAPFFPISLDDGTYVVGLGGDSTNPLIMSRSGSYDLTERDVFETQLYANVILAKGLTFEEKVSFQQRHINTESWRNAANYVTMNIDDSGYTDIIPVPANSADRTLSYNSTKNLRTTTQSFLRYKNDTGNHFFKALLGVQTEEDRNGSFKAGTQDFLNGSLQDLDLGAVADPSIGGGLGSNSSSAEWAIVSVLGRLNYDYMMKYMVEFSFRYDGTSRFAKSSRWGFFPSVSLGWNLKKESFLKDIDFINMLKLRGSWGQLGDAFKVGNYEIYQTVAKNSGYVWPNGTQPGLVTGSAANSNITWETATVKNIGVDASLWKGKLGIQTEYFINNRTDILGTPDVAKEFGLGAPAQNVRDVKSWGWEFSLSHKNRIGKVGYEIQLNLSNQNNEVTDLGSTTADIGKKIIDKGFSINSLYGYRADGLITSEDDLVNYLSSVELEGPLTPYVGSVKLKDISGPDGVPDGIIDAQHDREVIDDNQDHYRIGGRIALSYKGFTFSALIDGVLDRQVYFAGNFSEIAFKSGISTPFAFQRVSFDPQKPDANAALPIIGSGHVNYDYSDYWIREASYVRMKNISLSYTFNKSLVKRLGFIEGVSMYGSVENAFLIWNNYFAQEFGWDPQLGAGAVDYPLARTFSFGLNLTF